MRRLPAIICLAGLALAGSGVGESAAMKEPRPRRSTELPLPRDGNVAVREELDAARRAGTLAAYDLFIRRHPDHPLVETARAERAALAGRAKQGE